MARGIPLVKLYIVLNRVCPEAAAANAAASAAAAGNNDKGAFMLSSSYSYGKMPVSMIE
jgi:hypothetical protein